MIRETYNLAWWVASTVLFLWWLFSGVTAIIFFAWCIDCVSSSSDARRQRCNNPSHYVIIFYCVLPWSLLASVFLSFRIFLRRFSSIVYDCYLLIHTTVTSETLAGVQQRASRSLSLSLSLELSHSTPTPGEEADPPVSAVTLPSTREHSGSVEQQYEYSAVLLARSGSRG